MKFRILFAGTALCAGLIALPATSGAHNGCPPGTTNPAYCTGDDQDVSGTPAPDDINTGTGDDSIASGAGNDTVNSGGGDDNVIAGAGPVRTLSAAARVTTSSMLGTARKTRSPAGPATTTASPQTPRTTSAAAASTSRAGRSQAAKQCQRGALGGAPLFVS